MKGSYHRQTAALKHWRQGLLLRLFGNPDTTAGPTFPLQKGIIIRHLQRLHYSLVLKKGLCILSGRKGSHRIPVTICDVSLGHEIQGGQHHKDSLPLIIHLFTSKCTFWKWTNTAGYGKCYSFNMQLIHSLKYLGFILRQSWISHSPDCICPLIENITPGRFSCCEKWSWWCLLLHRWNAWAF